MRRWFISSKKSPRYVTTSQKCYPLICPHLQCLSEVYYPVRIQLQSVLNTASKEPFQTMILPLLCEKTLTNLTSPLPYNGASFFQ